MEMPWIKGLMDTHADLTLDRPDDLILEDLDGSNRIQRYPGALRIDGGVQAEHRA